MIYTHDFAWLCFEIIINSSKLSYVIALVFVTIVYSEVYNVYQWSNPKKIGQYQTTI